MGVTYFRDDSPDDFGKLDRAFVTMFRITAGETWVDTPPPAPLFESANQKQSRLCKCRLFVPPARPVTAKLS